MLGYLRPLRSGTCNLEDSRMNRLFVLGIATFVAVVGIALVGGEKVAVAGHGCHGCSGCSGDCGGAPSCGGAPACCGCHGGLLARLHARKHRCCGCSGAAPACTRLAKPRLVPLRLALRPPRAVPAPPRAVLELLPRPRRLLLPRPPALAMTSAVSATSAFAVNKFQPPGLDCFSGWKLALSLPLEKVSTEAGSPREVRLLFFLG